MTKLKPTPDTLITFSLPLRNLVSIGRALYAIGEDTAVEVGLSEDDDTNLTASFDVVDEFLSREIGEDWLGDIEDADAEDMEEDAE